MIPYILATLVVYSGVFFGIGLKYIAPEEFPDGIKWLKLLQKILISIVIILSLSIKLPYWLISLIILLFIIIIYYKITPYSLFGIIFYLNPLLFGPIIFIYGLTYGTLAQEKNLKTSLKNIKESLTFIIFCYLPFLVAYM